MQIRYLKMIEKTKPAFDIPKSELLTWTEPCLRRVLWTRDSRFDTVYDLNFNFDNFSILWYRKLPRSRSSFFSLKYVKIKPLQTPNWHQSGETRFHFVFTLRSQIEGYTRLLIFRKYSILPAVIWAYPFINFQENFQPPCFFTYTKESFSTLPAIIRAYPCIRDLRVN